MVDISIAKARARSSPSFAELVESYLSVNSHKQWLAHVEAQLRTWAGELDQRQADLDAREARVSEREAALANPPPPTSAWERQKQMRKQFGGVTR